VVSLLSGVLKDRRWHLGIFAFLIAIAYCPCGGGALTFRWMLAALAPWLILDHRPVRLNWRAIPLGCFVAWMAMSALWSPQGYDAIGGLIQLAIAGGAFVLGANVRDPRPLYIGLAIGVPLSMAFDGFFPDYDLAGEAAAVAAIGVASWGDWFLLPFPLMALVLGHSRGAWLGLVFALLVGIRSLYGRLSLSAVVIGIICWKIFREPTASLIERWQIWQDTWAGVSLFGNGLSSFWTKYPYYAHVRDILVISRPDHAHNDFLEIVFEQGFVGAILAICAVGALLSRQWRTPEALVLIGVLAIAMVGFPLHMPLTLVVAAFASGRLCSSDALYLDARPWRISALSGAARANARDPHSGAAGGA